MKRKRNENEKDGTRSNRTKDSNNCRRYFEDINENNINDTIEELRSPLLHYAIKVKANTVIAELLLMGARLDVQDKDGKTVFDIIKELPLKQQNAKNFRINNTGVEKEDTRRIILKKLFDLFKKFNVAEIAQKEFETFRQKLLSENEDNTELENSDIFDQNTNVNNHNNTQTIKSTQIEKNNNSTSIGQLSSPQHSIGPNLNQYSNYHNFKILQNIYPNNSNSLDTNNINHQQSNIADHTSNKQGSVTNNQTTKPHIYPNKLQEIIYNNTSQNNMLNADILPDDVCNTIYDSIDNAVNLDNTVNSLWANPKLFLSKNSQNISILEIAINKTSPVLNLIQMSSKEELKEIFYSRDSKHRIPIAAATMTHNSNFVDSFLSLVIRENIINEKDMINVLMGNIIPIEGNTVRNCRPLLLVIAVKCEPFVIRNILEISPILFNKLIGNVLI